MVTSLAPQNLCKQSQEIRTYIMDFANLMVTGETIQTKSVSHELRGGGTSDLSITSDTVVGQTVTMVISGGTKNATYRIEVTITTSASATLQGDGLLKITN